MIPYLAHGFDIEGADSSKEMLSICRKTAEQQGLTATLYEQQMQALDLTNRYSTIIVPGGSFHLITEREEAAETLRSLNDIAARSLELTRVVSGLPWITDDMTAYESGALRYLAGIAKTDLELAINAAGSPWVTDGIVSHESFALNDLVFMADWNPEFARYALGFSTDAPVRARDVYLISDLYRLHGVRTEQIEHLIGQPWFTDGLDPEERAFIITLNSPDPDWFYDLVETRFTQSATISLPLTGEVDLWAFRHTPFPSDEDLLVVMEQAVRGAERFMAVPFPMNDVIVLFLEESKYLGGFGALHVYDHIRVARSGDSLVTDATVYHEVAHYYFSVGIGPTWLVEGGADFMVSYIRDWLGLGSRPVKWCKSTSSC